jgi:hypothetical protein
LCERDTFQGERCLYNALNDRIRNLLLSYDYSKSADPLQPLAAHLSSLLAREHPRTSDIVVTSADASFYLHKFVLSARSPYFRRKLDRSTAWKLPPTIPSPAFEIAIRWVYLGEIPGDVGGRPRTRFSEEEILEGIDKISAQLEMRSLWDGILENEDRRLARQNRTEEVERGRKQLESWFRDNVLKYKVVVDVTKADAVRWDRDNAVFADVLLRADEAEGSPPSSGIQTPQSGIPIGPSSLSTRQLAQPASQGSTLFPAHRAMLLRSPYFETMFSSSFLEAQPTSHLPISTVDCSPAVLEIILTYLYTERADIPLVHAVDVLFVADRLLIEKLKTRAAVAISTLGASTMTPGSRAAAVTTDAGAADEPLDIFEVLRAAWLLNVPRLEEFAARYFAYRLERYVDDDEFAQAVRESAGRIRSRQDTDSIELVDDIRYYLSERFRLRFEDSGIQELMDEDGRGAEQGGAEAWGAQSGLPTCAAHTLDGELAGDEFAADAFNYRLLLRKVDALLERLGLDA